MAATAVVGATAAATVNAKGKRRVAASRTVVTLSRLLPLFFLFLFWLVSPHMDVVTISVGCGPWAPRCHLLRPDECMSHKREK